ncbi:uncharacterized protein PV09_02071 [Verruconis gallopava]|uniref:Uncharacterized protein n=1 Tax=Verruconis gallopava TaxID=253628 RepID=A0A0D1XWN5_9PEZI|nr:uncharacterized protein PV09_02071 [Verruconis gallopava]KIW07206.1 hypothetical protein PV09_02071 [Verruconis gallopava]
MPRSVFPIFSRQTMHMQQRDMVVKCPKMATADYRFDTSGRDVDDIVDPSFGIGLLPIEMFGMAQVVATVCPW